MASRVSTIPPHPAGSTLILSRAEIAALMRPADYLAAVELAFRAAHQGRASSPLPLHLPVPGGGFHAKAAMLCDDRDYAALKLNGNFPGNPAARGLPTIQGAVLLCDAGDGRLLAVLDSIEITLRRTAAATALAARHLARPDSATVAMIGCGDQARPQLEALAEVLPIRRCLAFDIAEGRAEAFAAGICASSEIDCRAVADLRSATLASDVIVTCTTARAPLLDRGDVRPGAFVAAVGADVADKHEIAPALFAAATVVADVLAQCLAMGDLHHAVAAGAIEPAAVHAELGDLVAGAKPGRTSAKEITLFDSTGTALQDVASAAMAYERALSAGVGLPVALGG
ncbi:MAG: ornithine cyclodeaminase family protein [Novosphingobium sp.]